MRLKLLACKVLYREISYLSYQSNNIIDTTFLRQGYHDTPELLHTLLQKEIDRLSNHEDAYSYALYGQQPFDAVLLGYGLCSNAVVGLLSRQQTLVIPKTDDCSALLLGSQQKYKDYFQAANGGVYWYSPGWIENAIMPSEERVVHLYDHYVEKYGEENADYLMEMEQDWLKKYTLCAYIGWEGLPPQPYKDYTKQCADYLHWNYTEYKGDEAFLKSFLEGHWDASQFLVVPPGCKVIRRFDDHIIDFEKER